MAQPLNSAQIDGFNRFYAGKLGTQLTHKAQVLKGTYDFAVNGGAIGSSNIIDENGDPVKLTVGTIVKQVWSRTITTVATSASGTLALTAVSSGDLYTATAAASYSGIQAGTQDGAAANMLRIATADVVVQAKIATGALTAGKVEFYIECVNI